jgi:type II secretion system protein L
MATRWPGLIQWEETILGNTAVIRLLEGQLVWYPPGADTEPRALNNDIDQEKLRAMLAQRRVNVCFAAAGADARLLVLPVTAAEKKHISKSLPFTLEEQVVADVDDLHFAYCPLDKENFAVAIVAREKMEQWLGELSEFPGIQKWLPEPLLLPWKSGEWCLVVEGDSVIVRVGECDGFTVECELVGDMLQSVLQATTAPESVVIYGSDQAADTQLVPDEMREVVQWRSGNLYAAMLLSESSEVNLNLLQGEFGARLPLGRWWRQWRAVAAVFAAVFILQLAASFADYRSLSAQNLALRGAVQDSYRQAFPKGAVVDAEKQLRRQLDALRGTGQSSGFVSLMDRVGNAIAGMPGTTIASINYTDKGDEMRLNIVAADFEGVEKLRSRMNEAGLEAIMESSSTQGDRVSARLRVGERS